MSDDATERQEIVGLHRIVRSALTIADPQRVPEEIAVCPECGGRLWWQVTTADGLRDMVLDCENENEDEESDEPHRGWQSEWEPVFNAVRRWVAGRTPNAAISDRSGSGTSTHD